MQFDHDLLPALLAEALVALAVLSTIRTRELVNGEAGVAHFGEFLLENRCYIGSDSPQLRTLNVPGELIAGTMASLCEITFTQPHDGFTDLENPFLACESFFENELTGDKNTQSQTTDLIATAARCLDGEHLLHGKTNDPNELGAKDEHHRLLGRSIGGDE